MLCCCSHTSVYVSLQVYIQYMKFSRRAEGIKAARNVFKQAREDARCGHQIYVAAALMEYNISKVSNSTANFLNGRVSFINYTGQSNCLQDI